MHDVVIRGGFVVDGTGREGFLADVAVDGGRISAVGSVPDGGREEIDATGLLVTPGFIDIHTHYDGQVFWDPTCSPTPLHGVTTLVMGNCGVGFAPVRAEDRGWSMGLMEGVEEIPAQALAVGLPWDWETFPEYLDALRSRPLAVDVGALVPLGPLTVFVMGDRGARDEAATEADIETMARLLDEAMDAGALGFSTSRILSHKGSDGAPVPGTSASKEQLLTLGRALAGRGVFLDIPIWAGSTVPGDRADETDRDFDWWSRLASETGQTILFPLIDINGHWKYVFPKAIEAWEKGLRIRTMTATKSLSFGLLTLAGNHPFTSLPSFEPLAALPFHERVGRMGEASVREALLAELRAAPEVLARLKFEELYVWGDAPSHAAVRSGESIAERAGRQGRACDEVLYDALLADDGREVVLPEKGDWSVYQTILAHPIGALGLSDGGAHVTGTSDQATPTIMLSYGLAGEGEESLYPLEWAVRKNTGDPAELFGMSDRGVLEPGRKADLNIIDRERVRLRRPEAVYDLPGGAAHRMTQFADGYVATMCSGVFIARDGAYTGAMPGKVVGRT